MRDFLKRFASWWDHIPSSPRKRGSTGSTDPRFRRHDAKRTSASLSSQRAFWAALLLLGLASCQPIPQPFADDRPPADSPILRLRDGAGIYVNPVENAPQAAETMAEALRKAGTPASTTAANRASWRLSGRSDGGTVLWQLLSPEGAVVGEARDAARIAALVQDPPVAQRDPGKPVLVVPPVEGAPGDGARSLPRAMRAALRDAQIETAEGAEEGKWVVAGRVALESAKGRQQHVRIVWRVRRPDGRELPAIVQENDVPAGSLDGAWGDIAWAVASAAAEAIVPLIEKAAGS
jgi:hypothetical protein